MCRWAAYLGPETYLEDIISSPSHSLVAQSHDAHEAKTRTNGDGFGVAWYGHRSEPGLYRDILPAWSDQNLRSLARQIRSRLFLAHVRASTGGLTSRSNCHPFVSGRWSFMHNGQIGNFDRLRRRLESHLGDELYTQKHGATDSELIFLLMLEFGLDNDPVLALTRTVSTIVEEAICAGVPPFLRLTAAFSEGNQLYAIRYATEPSRRRSIRRRLAVRPACAWCRNPLMGKPPTGWPCQQTASLLFPGRGASRSRLSRGRFPGRRRWRPRGPDALRNA
ncbi:hypothetical protein B998_01925 [Brucella sp. F96/2]|nr:glutamine amidotransferase class-II [Brucella ceti B1/94]EEZ09222.1 glutamine amidotransferase class-II [Brucella ceti M490/95/1]ENT07856.1 hypothetical protein C983_01549 [Brucella sp. F23/97]ENT15781.1 hypothetical protein B998_01925 [Brucella sp. F96/2]ENT21435.1 hypothetical protein C065_01545 [Brucella sp. UK1/97]